MYFAQLPHGFAEINIIDAPGATLRVQYIETIRRCARPCSGSRP